MNGQHLGAFLWLRWRIRVNQFKRGGVANAVILTILAVAALLIAAFMAVALFLVGLLLLPEAPPSVLLYVWDGVVLVFLFWWCIGILTELQRSEALSLDKFLHLPVSLRSAFLINYCSSLLSLTMIVFLPAMIGLSFGLVFAFGPLMLLLFPLFAAFLLMVTALTYQFQGWLASLMANKRRRQTIIVMLTMGMILLCQLPNLVNLIRPWGKPDSQLIHLQERQAALKQALDAGEITPAEFLERNNKLQEDFVLEHKERNREALATLEWAARLINLVLPPGWLPLGALNLAEGNVVPALLGTVGLSLIGGASLWRAYRTTIRYYTGQYSAGQKATTPAPASAVASPAYFLEKKLPWISEATAAVALASLRSLLRAPEAKMLLLSPILLVVVFGSMFMAQSIKIPEGLRPLLPFAGTGLVLLSMVNLAGNQFGFDRNGFRVYVLSPVRRSEILAGKNLALAPLTFGMSAVLVLLAVLLFPIKLEYLIAAPLQMISMFLVFCVLANWLSILGPMAIAAGSLKPASSKGIPLLLNLAFVFLFPLALVPILLPQGVEALLHAHALLEGVPICLLLTVVECALCIFLYRLLIHSQGDLLQRREHKILQLVASKAE